MTFTTSTARSHEPALSGRLRRGVATPKCRAFRNIPWLLKSVVHGSQSQQSVRVITETISLSSQRTWARQAECGSGE